MDFSQTGLEESQITERIEAHAKIAANHGVSFGRGGEQFMRFNLACPRSMVENAIERMQAAFG